MHSGRDDDQPDARAAADEPAGGSPEARPAIPVVLSARSPEALSARAAAVAEVLRDTPSPVAVAAALARARVHHHHRLAVAGSDGATLAARLQAFADGRSAPGLRVGGPVEPARLVFICGGQGTQWPGMGRDLLARDPAFRAAFVEFSRAVEARGGPELVSLLERTDPAVWSESRAVHPLLTGVQIGLGAALAARGITPDCVIGHSLGESAAAYLAGALSIDGLAHLVTARTRALAEAETDGRMCVVDADDATLKRALADTAGVSIAVHNGPRAWVLSGSSAAVRAVEAQLAADGVRVRTLAIDQPFHSPLLRAPAEALFAGLADLDHRAPKTPLLSSSSGRWHTDFDPAYWRDHLLAPTRFAESVDLLLGDGLRIFVEIAPHPSLAAHIEAPLSALGGGHLITTMRRGRPGSETLAEALGALYVAGVALDWRRIFPADVPSAALPAPPSASATPPATPGQTDLRRLDPAARSAAVRARIADLITGLLDLSEPLADDASLAGAGFDSMHALRLRGELEAMGITISLGGLMGDVRLADVVALAEQGLAAPAPDRPAEGPGLDLGDALDPFPLTDIQEAYLAGRSPDWPLGGVACHAMFGFEGPALDPARLERAWSAVVGRHPALRAVLTAAGRQRILAGIPPWTMPVHDLRAAPPAVVDGHLAAVGRRFGRRVCDPLRWPTFAIELTRLPGDRCRVHVDFDLISVDAAGLFLALSEWGALYAEPHRALPAPSDGFRAAVIGDHRRRETARWRAHEAWWVERIEALPPPPELPFARPPAGLRGMAGEHHTAWFEAARWQALIARARAHGLSASVALGAAFAEVLAAWSGRRPFTLTLTLFRPPLDVPPSTPLVGEFTTTLLLAVDCAGATFADRARAWRDQLAAALEHVDCGGVAGLRAHARETGASRQFPVVFTSLVATDRATLADSTAWLGETVETVTQTPQAWIDGQALPERGGLRLNWDVPEGLFPPGLVERALGAWVEVLGRLADGDGAWRAPRVDRLPAVERDRRAAYNRTDAHPASTGRLFDAFRACADATPDRIAVIGPDGTLDYRTLDARANQVGHALAEHRVAPGEPVVICVPRGAAQVIAVLGVHAAGGAYVPLDPDWPAARRARICARCGVRVAVVAGAVDGLPDDVRIVDLGDTLDRPTGRRPAPQSPADRAYIIHTSGSTGEPKGVVMSHRATLNTIVDINRRFGVGPDDRVLAVSSLAFDLSVYDIFGPLSVGGAVVALAPERARDMHHWMACLEAHGITLWSSVPALFELLVEAAERQAAKREGAAPGALRAILLSGDWVPVDLPDRGRRLWPEARIDSLGGATEAAIWSIAHPTDALAPDATSVPYGTPLTHQRVYVLDDRLEPSPEWVPGELYIGGAGLADGYWRDPERTAARFVEHPRTGERLYRTGDQGRFLPSGVIEFLGRVDQQVKIGGHRVELGEIEAALRARPDVSDAVVDAPGDRHRRRLVGYVVPADPAAPPDPRDLEAALAERLPAVMVPRAWVSLPAVPLTANGKVDRRSLPPPPTGAAPREPADATPAGPALRRVLAAVGEVMPGLRIGADDDMVRAGANSVDLIRLGARLNEVFGARPPMAELLQRGTPAALARFYLTEADALADDTPGALAVLTDPDARAAHKARRLGLRPTGGAGAPFAAPERPLPASLARISQRVFAAEPLPREAIGRWLSVLCPLELGDEHRHRHASAGGTYGVRTYLCIAPDRVAGQPGGAYYHDPVAHALVPVGGGVAVTPDMHVVQNRPWIEAAPLLLFFVVERRAIEPIYGATWRDFALIEIGARAQLLEERAARVGLGACQIGVFDRARFAEVLGLGETEALLHGLAAGGAAFEHETI